MASPHQESIKINDLSGISGQLQELAFRAVRRITPTLLRATFVPHDWAVDHRTALVHDGRIADVFALAEAVDRGATATMTLSQVAEFRVALATA